MDCWVAVSHFYKIAFGVDLGINYDTTPDPETTQMMVRSNIGKFEKIEKPIPGDLMLIKIRGIESHIGVYLSPTTFFHSLKETGVAIERLAKWEKLVVGFYRLQNWTACDSN